MSPTRTPSAPAPGVARPASDAAFVAAARDLADALRPGAVQRDRERGLPTAELELLRRSGLLGLPVPRAHGGVGASHVTIVEVFAILAAADPAFAQIWQPHTSFLEMVATGGTPEQQERFFAAALDGARFGNALSERGTKTVFEYRTRLTREGAEAGTFLLSGTKYYSTGAAGADWVGVFALTDDGGVAVAYVPAGTPGLAVEQDWPAFGQRSTLSGTTRLDAVIVPERDVVTFDGAAPDVPSTSGAFAQLVHGAIDLGIAQGALRDGIAYVRERARPYPLAGVDRAAHEQGVQQHYGLLSVRVDAARALLREAAATFDASHADPIDERIRATRLAVAGAKAFAGDVALEVAGALFEGAGAGAVDEAHGLDRHWRNARVHTLHDPNRWKYVHIGEWLLTDTPPAPTNHLV